MFSSFIGRLPDTCEFLNEINTEYSEQRFREKMMGTEKHKKSLDFGKGANLATTGTFSKYVVKVRFHVFLA